MLGILAVTDPIGTDDMTDLVRRFATWMDLLVVPIRAYRQPEHELPPASPALPLTAAPLPLHRSPYGLDNPLDGAATVAVRPYLMLHELRHPRPTFVPRVA